MERQEVLEFVKRFPVSHMATVEDGQPRVRAMQTAVIDDAGLTFCTGSHKDVCRQLSANPSVELAYWDPSSLCGKWSSTAVERRFSGDCVFDGMIRTDRALSEEDSSLMEEAVSCCGVLLSPLVRVSPWLGTASAGCVPHIRVATTRIPCPTPASGTVAALWLV